MDAHYSGFLFAIIKNGMVSFHNMTLSKHDLIFITGNEPDDGRSPG